MASQNGQPAAPSDPTADRPIPLVALRRPTLDASSSTSLDSSSPTTAPSTPASLTPPTSAHDSSSTSSQVLSPCQTTCVSDGPASASSGPEPPSVSLPSSQFPADIPRSVTEDSEQHPTPQRRETWLSIMQPWDHRRTWVQNSIGLAALAVALVGLFVYALRGYKMAKWTVYNDLLQSCAALVQVNVSGGPRCEKVLHDGPREQPYDKPRVMERIRDKVSEKWHGDVEMEMYGIEIHDGSSDKSLVGIPAYETWLRWDIIIGCLCILCMSILLVLYLRRGSRVQPAFQSPARSEGPVRVTQHHLDGIPVDESKGLVEIRKHQPGYDSSIRRRVKQKAKDKKTDLKSKISWKPVSASSSATTLVGKELESDKGHEEHHDGLIELNQTNGTRNFLDPETGETLHLSPWKSTHDSSEDEEEENSFEKLEKGIIKRKLTEMGVGSALIGGGKAAERSLHEKAQAESKCQPQQMGDSLAGLVSNESSSVMEALK